MQPSRGQGLGAVAISLNGLLTIAFALLAWRAVRAGNITSHCRWALRTCFTLGELRTFRGDEDNQVPRGERDHLLRRRLAEIRASIHQMRRAERLLAEALSCGYLDLAACPTNREKAR